MRSTSIYFLAALCLLTSCTLFRPRPFDPLLVVNSDSVSAGAYAALPSYLVPAPAGSTPSQVRQWQAAQRVALKNSTKPGSVKLKNVANTTDNSKVKDQSKTKDQSKQKDRSDHRDQHKEKPDNRDQSDQRTGISGGQALAAGVGIIALLLFFIFLFRSKNAKTIE